MLSDLAGAISAIVSRELQALYAGNAPIPTGANSACAERQCFSEDFQNAQPDDRDLRLSPQMRKGATKKPPARFVRRAWICKDRRDQSRLSGVSTRSPKASFLMMSASVGAASAAAASASSRRASITTLSRSVAIRRTR